MSTDSGLVACLVERLTTRLPHRTGNLKEPSGDGDTVIAITRSTLLKISATSISLVLECLLSLLEDLGRNYKHAATHPPHILLSEIHVLSIFADCCNADWDAVRRRELGWGPYDDPQAEPRDPDWTNDPRVARAVPDALDDLMVPRIFELLKVMIEPIEDGFVLPTRTILGDASPQKGSLADQAEARLRSRDPADQPHAPELLDLYAVELDTHVKTIVQYVTASSWNTSFDFFRSTIFALRNTAQVQTATLVTAPAGDDDRAALIMLRLACSFWVDGQRLGHLIQELCSSFLHFRRGFQNTVAVVTPLVITRWMERYPEQFVQMHTSRKRIDTSADTLFDMTQTVIDNGRRRAVLFPLQTTLLFLIPDVFAIASNLRDAKSASLQKKVAFLEVMRKSLKNNRNESAAYCMISVLRAARHFDAESDSAMLSYAMDIQDEVRDALFRRQSPITDANVFDQDLMTAAFVSLAHLNFESCVKNLTPTCLASNAPQTFKFAVVQACTYFASLPNAQDYQPLFTVVSSFIQSQLKTMTTLSKDLYSANGDAPRTREKNSPYCIICSILEFLDAHPSTLFEGPPEDPAESELFYEANFESFLSCMITANDQVRRRAGNVAGKLLSDEDLLVKLRESKCLDPKAFKYDFWRLSSLVLMNMCDNVGREGPDAGLRSIHSYLESRLLLLKSIHELSQLSDEVPERTAASTKLETLFLVSLCAPDVETCQLVTSCIYLFLEECQTIDTASEGAKSSSTLIRNGDVFIEIASRSFRFTGLVAFQTRIRMLLRRLQYPSMGILDAWEMAFERWLRLSKEVSTRPIEQVREVKLAEWRNFSGFLASLGGVCTADQASMLEEPAISGLRWIDKVFSENYEEALLARYLKVSVQLLTCSNVKVREAMRQVLSSEISPPLFQPLFKTMETELDVLFAGALETAGQGQDGEIVFAEQASSLLKSLVERLVTPADLGAASCIQLGQLTLNFAKFLDGVLENSSSLRVKIKVCQLCEAVTKRKEHLNLRDDVRIRNQLLEHIYNWIPRPRSPRIEMGRQDEFSRVQKDLERACLRALADLTYRLPLQPGDGQSDASTSDLKSQMFSLYFKRFIMLLNSDSAEASRTDYGGMTMARDDAAVTSDLAITILSNLLSANIDVGLKHSLNIGYHESVDIRMAFIKVLHNILLQGAEFSNLSDATVAEKYDELLDLLTHDTTLAGAMSAICPSQELDELTMSLLSIYETRGRTFELVEALVKQEIEDTENESELLRRTCVATKMLSVYAKWKGQNYMRETLQKVIDKVIVSSPSLNLEMDPERVSSKEELATNTNQLGHVAGAFIGDICSSSTHMPIVFRKICSIISEAVVVRFPEAKYTAVGAFIFLRFFCPAIVAPDVEGLVSHPPTKEMRRGLLLIAKIIQNLANNVLFGAKEPYMFPLNPFLAERIYQITTFLREISAPPSALDLPPISPESFDFGSCVALHRFLYDHWDQVRQRLATQERRDIVRSPGDAPRGRSPVLEPLKTLITNLGPPPLAVTWNRPQVNINTPPQYSRFQNFMLKHAARSAESYVTSRAVYDGGESKDGLSIICVILRNIDQENIDYDTLIYCYLRLASRLWHKRFGVLIDATCYSGQNEPADELFKKLDRLTPAEIMRNLTRVYVYNMNSAFRKCFRRMLKLKSSTSVFGPRSVEYHLFGSLQELQAHFHLGQLHLQKETISVVTDTRYVFQNITKFSPKSKARVEVVVKVGSQFVQITTTTPQDVNSAYNLRVTINDIYRLGELDEPSPPSQGDDDGTFTLRADNGKTVLNFISPKKIEIMKAIYDAKQRFKDTRALKPFERLIRPQDVPGTLLNLALTNLASPDPVLRISSYNLLGSLCRTFNFSAASKLMCTSDVSVPLDPSRFIINISKDLAVAEPQLTGDFLNEFFVGWDSFSDYQKPLSLAYMAPWLPGLRTTLLVSEPDGDKGREKIASIFRKLINVAIQDPSLNLTLEQTVWPMVYHDEVLLEIFFDELFVTARPLHLQDERLENLTSIVAAIGTITLRGKILSRLRKAINRSSLRGTKHLADNTVWPEICVLLHFAVSLSFDNGVQAQLYLPEIFHIVTMLANTGSADVRLLVHRFLVNSIHAACTSFSLDETRLSKLRGALESLSEPRSDIFSAPSSFVLREGGSMSTSQESGPSLAATENLATLMFEVCSVAATSVDISNAWRARWMSLVASTAFQNNPAIQPRAFTVMGCLAREEIDDDLLYQVLVALRQSVTRFGEDSNAEMLVAIVTSLSKMISKLHGNSRYGLQLFWLAMAILRLVPATLFNCAAAFLEGVLSNIASSTDIRGEKTVAYLLQGRQQGIEEASLALDAAYGVHFNAENFHFAVCATLVRGLTDTVTKAAALRVLSIFLEITTAGSGPTSKGSGSKAGVSAVASSPYTGLILSRAVTHEELKDSLWLAGINPGSFSLHNIWSIREVQAMKDKDLLLNEAIAMLDFQYLEDAVQNRALQWFNELALGRPAVMIHLCGPIIAILDEILLRCQNSATLESAHTLLQTLTSNPKYSHALDSGTDVLAEILDDMGFGGLWRSCSFNEGEQPDRQCFLMTDRLIEVCLGV